MPANLHLLPFELNTRGNLAKNSILFYSIALYSIFFHSFGVLYVALDGSRACSIWTRIENVDRTNQLLLGEKLPPPGFSEHYFARVQAYTAGYDREIGHIPHLSTAIGGQVTWYGVPDALRSTYGAHPVGGLVFLRFRVH